MFNNLISHIYYILSLPKMLQGHLHLLCHIQSSQEGTSTCSLADQYQTDVGQQLSIELTGGPLAFFIYGI